VTLLTDTDMYLRGAETLLYSWEAIARGSRGAAVIRSPGVASAVFPNEPERAVYNNALLERDLAACERADALEAMEAAYASAGVTRFAAWVHEGDGAMGDDMKARGYALDETTRAMGMALADIRVARPSIDVARPDWSEYLRYLRRAGLPPGLLSGVDPGAFHLLTARLDGRTVATAIAIDRDDDCGIYNVSTLAHARRRGLGTALTALHAHDALARGCRTASLQSTEAAVRIYTAVGFRDLGRILEYARQDRPPAERSPEPAPRAIA
jgi:ribosomal protein S18 acetylase RimI-like enzyme